MEKITKHIEEGVPWFMLLANDIGLVGEIKWLNTKLELRRDTLESKNFTLNRLKTEYIKCHFSKSNSSKSISMMMS